MKHYCTLTDKEKFEIQVIHWLIDHPEQKPDAVTAEGHPVFRFRKNQPVQERRPVSVLQYDRLVQTRAALLQRKTNESFRKCFFWAQNELVKEYEIRENEMRKAA